VPEQPAATALVPEFEAVLRTCLDGLVSPDAPLQEDSDLAMVGIDSLTIVRLLVMIEDTFAVAIPDEVIVFDIFSSPGALWAVISGLMEAPG
jgi:acyl carrier protein